MSSCLHFLVLFPWYHWASCLPHILKLGGNWLPLPKSVGLFRQYLGLHQQILREPCVSLPLFPFLKDLTPSCVHSPPPLHPLVCLLPSHQKAEEKATQWRTLQVRNHLAQIRPSLSPQAQTRPSPNHRAQIRLYPSRRALSHPCPNHPFHSHPCLNRLVRGLRRKAHSLLKVLNHHRAHNGHPLSRNSPGEQVTNNV